MHKNDDMFIKLSFVFPRSVVGNHGKCNHTRTPVSKWTTYRTPFDESRSADCNYPR